MGRCPGCVIKSCSREPLEGTVLRTLAGEVSAPEHVACGRLMKFLAQPTGTSSKFVNGIADALDCFQEEHKVKLEKVTKIPLEGEGTINRRVERYVASRLDVPFVSMMSWLEQIVPKLDW